MCTVPINYMSVCHMLEVRATASMGVLSYLSALLESEKIGEDAAAAALDDPRLAGPQQRQQDCRAAHPAGPAHAAQAC